MSQSPGDVPRTVAGIADLPTSDRHKLLAAERRRTTLDVLTRQVGPVDLENLAAAVTARETAGAATDAEAVERVAISLHHAHLPMMSAFGVIDYDPEATRVESCPRRSDPRNSS
jgi:hypothetical protein